ncbi:MAG: hypothetical protein AVDCRST_MAG01-01-3050, partial [uncultured Rubrobacteraceae bacterium]
DVRLPPAHPTAGRGAHAGGAGLAGGSEPQRGRHPGARRQEAAAAAHRQVPLRRPEPTGRRTGGPPRVGARAGRDHPALREISLGVPRGARFAPARHPAGRPRAGGSRGEGPARSAGRA